MYASPTLLLRSDVSCLDPSLLWNLMSNVCSSALTVAESAPEFSTVPFSVFEMLAFTSGLPLGNKSKSGPRLAAPAQWVVSTDITPSKAASISYHPVC